MDRVFAMRVFIQVVEDGSFSKAGPRLGVTQSAASRIVSALEAELDVRLLHRSTRNLSLTEAGQIYYERSRQIISDVDDADAAVASATAEPGGHLRVTAPASFARRQVSPFLGSFFSNYPKITVSINASDNVHDVIAEGFDLAIRLGRLVDSSLIVRRLASARSVVCAHPDYLAAHGEPAAPKELEMHNCLCFRGEPGKNTWRFKQAGRSFEAPVSGSLFSDNGDTLLEAAASGLGVVLLPLWAAGPEIDKGRLKIVLSDFGIDPEDMPINAVLAGGRRAPRKVHAFIEFLKARYDGCAHLNT